jgi:transcriptional regulator with GAF, ATPase, and Fis domain
MMLSSVKSSQMEQLNKEAFIFESRVMSELLGQLDQVAPTESTILIQGETGVGKELFVGRVHSLSNRRTNPLEIIELTSIPENLLESELVGYEKGAFTGADRQKRGRVELAHKGTLFLDEIGDIPQSLQVKLLRILQEKSFKRLGGTKTLSSDFRLIVATNKNLQKEVASGRFRQDIFYRLNVITITIPPLREREDDAVVMAQHFLAQYTQKHDKGKILLRPEDISVLRTYPWPGNVRELKNVIERAVLLSRNGRLDFSSLQIAPRKEISSVTNNYPPDSSFGSHLFEELPTLEDFERQYIRHVINKTGGKLSGPGGASELLGMKRETLYSRMKRLGLK